MKKDDVIYLASQNNGYIFYKDLEQIGIPSMTMTRLERSGVFRKVNRGCISTCKLHRRSIPSLFENVLKTCFFTFDGPVPTRTVEQTIPRVRSNIPPLFKDSIESRTEVSHNKRFELQSGNKNGHDSIWKRSTLL